MIDAQKVKQAFPILDQVVNDEPLVYLDNAATTQKSTSQISTLTVVGAEQRILQIPLHAEQLQLIQGFGHLRRRNDMHLVAIILFQAS